MGRAALTADDHAAFRRAMREVATRRFAAYGEAGVTMRGLAEELGCSPMTPYRYFRDKDEIFDMVRAAALEAFAEAQERAYATEADPEQRLRALARAYVAHAVAHPDQYRVIFQLERPLASHSASAPDSELAALERRGWMPMHSTVAAAVASGAFTGDADELAHLYWATLHGLVMLHLAGKLRPPRTAEHLMPAMVERLLAASRSPRMSPPRKRTR